MKEYEVVRFGERSELLPGGRYRSYKRAEIMVGPLGPFTVETEAVDGWEHTLRAKCQEEARRVRMVTE